MRRKEQWCAYVCLSIHFKFQNFHFLCAMKINENVENIERANNWRTQNKLKTKID